MIQACRLLFLSVLFVAGSALGAAAYNLPALNLGFTSFLDGAPPAGPGHYVSEYLQYYSADRLDNAPPGAKVDVTVLMNQYVYQSDQPILFGGKWGLNLMLPIVSFSSDDTFGLLSDNGTRAGDLLIGPFLQWDPIMGANGPIFMQRIELQTILPTGAYDKTKVLNQGSNICSFDPYWAATLFITPQLSASWRVHYLWNGVNDDPFAGSGADSLRPGQAFHANFATEYEVLPKQLRLGVNGYYLKQTTRSEVNGVAIADDKEKVFGLGPGLIWHLSPNAHVFANIYVESQAENRPEGERYNLRFVGHF